MMDGWTKCKLQIIVYPFKNQIQLYVSYSVPALVFNTYFDFTLNSVNFQSEAINKKTNHSEIKNIITILHFSLVLLLLWIFFSNLRFVFVCHTVHPCSHLLEKG